jgi:excisionase family DNA binding protein
LQGAAAAALPAGERIEGRKRMDGLEQPGADSPAVAALLTLGEAAHHLGLSVDTVRRRVKDGSLTAHKVGTRHGPAWGVQLDGARPTVRPADAPQPSHDAAGLRALLELLAVANERLTALAEQAGYLRARLEAAEAEVAALREQLARRDIREGYGGDGAG